MTDSTVALIPRAWVQVNDRTSVYLNGNMPFYVDPLWFPAPGRYIVEAMITWRTDNSAAP